MTNLNVGKRRSGHLLAVLGFHALLCLPITALAKSMEAGVDVQSPSARNVVAAVAPSLPGPLQQPFRRAGSRRFHEQLAEARTILGELRAFADTAQTAIQLGHRVEQARLANSELKVTLAKDRVIKDGLNHDVDRADTRVERFTSIIVDHWLTTVSLDHQDTIQRERLASAGLAWRDIERRLRQARQRLAALQTEVRELRAERAAFAAEIGRTRRELDNVTMRMAMTRSEQRAIEAATQKLRKSVSAGLRTLIWDETGAH